MKGTVVWATVSYLADFSWGLSYIQIQLSIATWYWLLKYSFTLLFPLLHPSSWVFLLSITSRAPKPTECTTLWESLVTHFISKSILGVLKCTILLHRLLYTLQSFLSHHLYKLYKEICSKSLVTNWKYNEAIHVVPKDGQFTVSILSLSFFTAQWYRHPLLKWTEETRVFQLSHQKLTQNCRLPKEPATHLS